MFVLDTTLNYLCALNRQPVINLPVHTEEQDFLQKKEEKERGEFLLSLVPRIFPPARSTRNISGDASEAYIVSQRILLHVRFSGNNKTLELITPRDFGFSIEHWKEAADIPATTTN